jgi:ribonucleotide reductase beta subunit family protein with ferritin-like domain
VLDAALDEALLRPHAFDALYEHWERHQWSPLSTDLSADAAAAAELTPEARAGLIWIFAHRFHAEWNVAALLAPFLLAAPDYDMQLLLATQVADEYRHIQSVVRVFTEVFDVQGGVLEVKALADEHLDPVAETFYAALDGVVRPLETARDEDTFLQAVVAYHLIAEGSIGRANQTLVASRFTSLDAFPGLQELQYLAVRDELRHIGIGVSYARRRLARDREHATELIGAVVDTFRALGSQLLEGAGSELAPRFLAAYGAEPAAIWQQVLHQLELRLRAAGYELAAARD